MMDRHSFLSSLDVLLPSASSEWPPRPLIAVVPDAVDTSTTAAAALSGCSDRQPPQQQQQHQQQQRHDEWHLDHQFLSIEAVLRQPGSSSSSSSNDDDESMPKLQDKPKSDQDKKQHLRVIFFDANSSSSSSSLAGDPATDPALCSAALHFYGTPSSNNCQQHTVRLNKNNNNNHHHLDHTPVSHRSFPSVHPRSPSHPAGPHQFHTSMACLTLRANDRVYYIDWTQLTDVQVLEATNDIDNDDRGASTVGPTETAATTNEPQLPNLPPRGKPSCLLLHFPSCVFRIFALPNNEKQNNNNNHHHLQPQPQSMTALYRTLQQRLQQWCLLHTTDNGGGIIPTTLPILPGRRSLFESPVRLGSAGTTTESSSGEAAQTRMSLPQPPQHGAALPTTVDAADDNVVERNNGIHATTTAAEEATTAGGKRRSSPLASSSSSSSPPPPPSRQRRKTHGTDAVETRVEGHVHALRQCQTHLTSLFTFLTMPLADMDTGSSNVTDGSWAEAMGTLLTTIADELAESYVPPVDIDNQRQRNEEVLAATKQQFEQTLNAFFPAPQRGGTSSQQARRRKQQQRRQQQQQERQGLRRAPPVTQQQQQQQQQPGHLSSDKKDDAKPSSTSSVETTAKQVHDLLQTYQAAVRQRHELLCLPSRGGPA